MTKKNLHILCYVILGLIVLFVLWGIVSFAFVKFNSSKYDLTIVPHEQIERLPKSCRYLCYVDFNKPSRENRFFIFDVKKKECLYTGLVEHGNGGTIKDAKCSNVKGSKCSSKGLYKVIGRGKMNNTKWNCFYLDGLDSTNSNAKDRCIYIHFSRRATTYFEEKGAYLERFTSDGCFAISWFPMRYLEYLYDKDNMYLYAQYNNQQ